MNEENLAVIEKLAGILGSHGEAILSEYKLWFITSSLLWVLGGVGLAVSVFRSKYRETTALTTLEVSFIRALLLLLSFLMLVNNVPDLVAPEAASIHQLIRDLT